MEDRRGKKTNSHFVQQCGAQLTIDKATKRHYYYCNRSGHYINKGSGNRQLKLQGSSKLGDVCSAYIKAFENIASKAVHVEYCLHHHNHKTELGHLTMNEHLRAKIASKLHEGVSEKRILDEIRDNVTDTIGREHLTSIQDIQNIRRQYNVEGIQRHHNDHQSVDILVQELQEQDYNPILLYKAQGIEQGDDVDNLAKDDMLLCIQTEFQKDAAIKFGNKVVCADSTHGTTMYDFLLITLMVLDEYDEGIPIAWAITNREDQSVLVEFFKSIKSKVGNLSPKVFMSDCADQFYNAWVGVFEEKPLKLICTWHVDKAWRKKLSELVASKERRVQIYHHLRLLLEERDIPKFEVLLQKFLSYLEEDEISFFDYFKNTYVSCKQQWAYAYRMGSGINTNMYIESFHRVLKVVYLESKQNRRVDRLCSVLLRFAKDKTFDRICKLEKGKSSHRIKEILKRHKMAEEMHNQKLLPERKQGDGISWIVPSQSNSGQTYVVKSILDECSCNLKCTKCSTCIHMYLCTCADSHLQHTVCKHIHLVQIVSSLSSTSSLECDPSEDVTATEEVENTACMETCLGNKLEIHDTSSSAQSAVNLQSPDYFVGILKTSSDNTVSQQKKVIGESIYELQMLVDSTFNYDALVTAKKHIIAAVSSLKVIDSQESDNSSPFNIRKRPASNAKHEKQKRFFSTRKKKPVEKRWAKPSFKEKEKCLEELDDVEVKYCSICMKEDDPVIKEKLFVSWIECSSCGIWMHESCIDNDSDVEFDSCDDYLCKLCDV